MAATKDAVLSYTKRTVDINFTGEVCCARCPLMETYSRKQCRASAEYIVDDRTIGGWCPLVNPETGEREGIFYQTI
jgi:hypothetical protein